jgi:hypothetical protein
MLIWIGLLLSLTAMATGCGTVGLDSSLAINSPNGGGTLGGMDSQREGGMRNLYGWR